MSSENMNLVQTIASSSVLGENWSEGTVSAEHSTGDIAIRVQNLSKCYQIYDKPHDRLKQSLYPRMLRLIGKPARQYHREFWALKDVSFEIKKGETVGIIGRNGSGKSTLLQLICGTLMPTTGSVETNGGIAALLELGSGFNPEFTGRENVRMSCALLGLSPAETEARFDDIAAFADIGDFIEQPVKTYSSGMYVRLAFAVNIVSRPDIMIVDEALAVGDMNFQAKCMTALVRTQESGATVLFVSHNIDAVKSLCSCGIYLEHGTVKAIGKASDVAEFYIRNMREEMNAEQRKFTRESTNSETTEEAPPENEQTVTKDDVVFKHSEEFDQRVALFRYGSGGARVTYVELLDHYNHPIRDVEFDQQVNVAICFETELEEEISCNYYIADAKKNFVIGCGMDLPGYVLKSKKNGKYTVIYRTRIPLCEGDYSIQLELTRSLIFDETVEFLDVIDNAIVFKVYRRPNGRVWAQMYVPNTLEVIEE
jgi:lipopolysaccharide transport system ATP-binding protein